jgi:hypothetical protein
MPFCIVPGGGHLWFGRVIRCGTGATARSVP